MVGTGAGAADRRRNRLRRVLRGALPVVVGLAALSLAPAQASATPRGGVTPVLECVVLNKDGSFTGVVGYTSTYPQTTTIPLGSNNYISPSTYNGKQPTSFKPGTQHGVFAVTVSNYDGLYSHPTWYVDGHDLTPGWDTELSPSCPLPTPLPAQGNDAGAAIVLPLAGALGVLLVLRLRRRALAAAPARTSVEERTDA